MRASQRAWGPAAKCEFISAQVLRPRRSTPDEVVSMLAFKTLIPISDTFVFGADPNRKSIIDLITVGIRAPSKGGISFSHPIAFHLCEPFDGPLEGVEEL